MRTRTKIMIVLFASTLALGALVLIYASDDVLHRFRWFVFNDPLQLIADVTIGLRTSNGLWYGWISMFAIIMIVLVFRAAHRNGSRGLRERLIDLKPTKVPAAKLRPSEMAAKPEVGLRCGTTSIQ